jgi:hypothetical protein
MSSNPPLLRLATRRFRNFCNSLQNLRRLASTRIEAVFGCRCSVRLCSFRHSGRTITNLRLAFVGKDLQ